MIDNRAAQLSAHQLHHDETEQAANGGNLELSVEDRMELRRNDLGLFLHGRF